MSSPTPVQSFVGGLGLSLSAYALLKLNGSIFGISGFLHRAVRAHWEPLASVVGLISSGALAGVYASPPAAALALPLPWMAVSGALVGIGTKLGNGCTSGHMICGLSRLSIRSAVATAIFFTTGAITARVLHGNLSPILAVPFDWGLGPDGVFLAGAGGLSILFSLGLSALGLQSRFLRIFAAFNSAFSFGMFLRLANMTDPRRVLRFLLLPGHPAFDASLIFLAISALPLSTLLYFYGGGDQKPRLGGTWAVPTRSDIDWRLVAGAATFGVGWGTAGLCPGPALVNLGAFSYSDQDISSLATWIVSMLIGGLLV